MTTSQAAPAPVGDERVEIIEPDHERYVRAAGDLIEAVIATILFVFTVLGAAVLRAVFEGAGQDVIYLTSLVPAPVSEVLGAVVGTMGILGPVVLAVELVMIRRGRLVLMVMGAALLAAIGMWAISRGLTREVVLPGNLGELQRVSSAEPRWVAAAAAAVTVINPWLSRLLRRLGIAAVAIVVLTRIATGAYVPYEAAVALTLGWLTGSAVLAVVGSVNRRPSGQAVVAALERAGLELTRLEMVGGGRRGSSIYRAVTRAGEHRFVKVFDPNQRETDMLVKLYRWLRLREPSDQRPFSSLRFSVEHEAFVALAATTTGIPTAPLVTVAEVDPDGMLLAFDYIDGGSLASRPPETLTADLLRRIWQIHAELRSQRIAHREFRLEHVLLHTDGRPLLVNFGFGHVAAGTELLNSDAAELLCSTALVVGAERAVAAAAAVVGHEVLADMSGRLQPLALSRPTRRRLRGQDGLLGEIRAEVQSVADLEEVQYEELARLRPRTVVTFAVGTVAAYVLLQQIAEARAMGDTLRSAQWIWVVPLTLAMILSWVGAAISVIGSVPDRLSFVPTLKAQVAASFFDILAPASLGGMALNTRFLQKRGVAPAVAVAGVGLNALAGFVVHVVILGVFLLWSGSSDLVTAPKPEASADPAPTNRIVIVALVLAVLAIAAWLIPVTRRLVRAKLIPVVIDAVRGLADLARKPRKLVALFSGSFVVTIGLYLAMLCAVFAFGGGPSPAQVGVAYLVAAALAMFVPTPGNVGALELLLTAAFTGLGMPSESALGATVLFRLGTFWLPIAPGWLGFQSLQRRGEL